MTATFDYGLRLNRVRSLMEQRGFDALMLSVGADLPYFTGYEATPLERLTMLVVPVGARATLIVPALEAPRVMTVDGFALRPWEETEQPVDLAVAASAGASRVAVGDNTWSTFLLALQTAMPEAVFEDASTLTRELRMRKDPDEIRYLREAAEATDRVVVRLESEQFSGRTEAELAAVVRVMTLEEGHDIASFGIVASGPNAASPHHEPGSRVVEAGDTVVVDFGGKHRQYCSDTTRTFSVGVPAAEVADAHAVLEASQAAARAAVRPGVTGAAVDEAARRVLVEAGYGERFIHRTGHGIGLEVHEHPYIVDGNDLPLETGMTFSIEPGIYHSGHWGMRIEDIVACGVDGVDELNRSERHLRVVG